MDSLSLSSERGCRIYCRRYAAEKISQVAITGSGGKLAAELIGGQFINEIIAQSKSVSKLYPDARTIIEMGGEDSKLILMDRGKEKSIPACLIFP